ncbi:suppressor protein SRP40 [Brassica rapa]|uniref:Uncharacterized protein n=2 Tax=Brassica TaxID=3705 RepID=M4DMI2_BRACM|nr:suppressor protein SRP40 [Brassica rapa]XP_009138368.1 suppressor protein SRP40 [Brassica rapa]XP_013643262.1 suppressor protein SRP40 [Brassica napus]XP_013643263.1 suppressor protein SRP40 [Brassica napus]CAF2133190.1 unnamed protein product [Brassica napus]CDY40626.1 BnaA03g53370D [Brassica napus]
MEMSQLDSDLRLPPRKRLLAGYMKLNGIGSSSSSSSSTSPSAAFPSSSSTSNSIGSSSSSASTSRFHSVQNQSPEELVEAARSAAASAVKAAKAARAIANEKALSSSKAIAAAKRALELVDSFPKQAMADCNEKKHVSVVDNLSSKDLACRLQRAIEKRYPKVLATREENGQINKKQKTVADGGSSVTGYVNGIAGVVDSDSSYDGLESNRKAFKPDEVDWIRTPGKEQRRGRVKLKKFPLSICDSTDQENGISSCVSPPVQDLKAPECANQNKAIRS